MANEIIDPVLGRRRRRQERTPKEMRNVVVSFKVSRNEIDAFYEWCRARDMSMSYFIRSALEQVYPEIWQNAGVGQANRFIRKPKKFPRPLQEKTAIYQSYVDGKLSIKPLTQEQQ